MPRALSMITAIELGSKERMVAFCQGIQRMQPVGSYIKPEPGDTIAWAGLSLCLTGLLCCLKLSTLVGPCGSSLGRPNATYDPLPPFSLATLAIPGPYNIV